MMSPKLLVGVLVAGCLLFTAGCSSTMDRIVYRPDINQGNYLVPSEVAQVKMGMTKEQVSYLLGTPMLKDPFGDNVWFYVFRQQPGHKPVAQQTVILTFNQKDVLSDIKKYDRL